MDWQCSDMNENVKYIITASLAFGVVLGVLPVNN